MTLRDLGFTAPQEALYRLLLAGRYCSPATLARDAGVGVEEAERGLEALVELGVLQHDPAEPLGVRVPRPEIVLGALIEQVEDRLMARYRRVSDTREVLPELRAGYVHGADPDDGGGVERLTSLDRIRDRLDELSFFTRSSLYAVQPGGPQSKASLDASRPLDERGLRRGIEMRVLHDVHVLDDELNRSYLRDLVKGGAQVRVTAEPLSRMVIMDREVAVVPLDPADSRRGALVVRQPGLVAGFLDLFQRLWVAADELHGADDIAEPPAQDVTEQDLRVLKLLASGATDETSAREIGVSVRHLRRTIARLMEALGASSRFEAGVEAARRGWI